MKKAFAILSETLRRHQDSNEARQDKASVLDAVRPLQRETAALPNTDEDTRNKQQLGDDLVTTWGRVASLSIRVISCEDRVV